MRILQLANGTAIELYEVNIANSLSDRPPLHNRSWSRPYDRFREHVEAHQPSHMGRDRL